MNLFRPPSDYRRDFSAIYPTGPGAVPGSVEVAVNCEFTPKG